MLLTHALKSLYITDMEATGCITYSKVSADIVGVSNLPDKGRCKVEVE